MKIAFIVYNQLTLLDFIGFYDPVTRLKSMGFIENMNWDICALSNEVVDDRGIRILASKVKKSLASYDLIFIPGGFGSRILQKDKEFINWIRSAESVKLKVSVCTGSLILGAAGFLADKHATTHPAAIKELKKYCLKCSKDRIVDQGNIITGSGVTASIDLGLHIVERLAGTSVRENISKQMDYPYKYYPK
jgi:cyclohexyl-isocyanide hydratase